MQTSNAHGARVRRRILARKRILLTLYSEFLIYDDYDGLFEMLIKILIVLTLVAILASLASGMRYLVKDKGQTTRTAKALTVRISLSLALFGLLMLGIFTGHIKPHGINPNIPIDQPGPATK